MVRSPPCLLLCAFCVPLLAGPGASAAERLPNIVVIFADDLGWGDLGCQGARTHRTPRLDRLAELGTRFESFYVSQPVCSASRTSLLTGCYANRLGIHGALSPRSKVGIAEAEVTLGELCRSRGYATAIFGKWHLGDSPRFLPTRHGFDEYLGLPYSNDMWPRHPEAPVGTYPPLPLIDGETIVETMPDQSTLTRRYTERAVKFIEKNRDRPFLLYLAHSMPHVPLHAGEASRGKSGGGLYGDVIEEIDASVGSVLDTLERLGLAENTWVTFTSDNGPWLSYGEHAGSPGRFREGKGTVFEGGVRVPCLMAWPGKIPAGRVSNVPLMTIDFFPTVAKLTGAQLPPHAIDGRDAWSVISGAPGAVSPHDAYYFYFEAGQLQALRSGDWKLHLPHTARVRELEPGGRGGTPVPYALLDVDLELYNLALDPSEADDLAATHPAEVKRLLELAERARTELGDALTGRKGSGVRSPGSLEN